MKRKRIFQMFLVVLALALCLCVPAFAAGGDVAGAVEQTWTDASSQIKTVVDNVVFPALSMVLAIAFFAKLAMAYFDYRKHGQFELSAWSSSSWPLTTSGASSGFKGGCHAERRI